MPVLSNLFGSYRLLGLALGTDRATDILQTYIAREKAKSPVKWVSKTEAPVKEVIWQGTEVDLDRLPIPKHCQKDSGRYVTIGCLVCVDPDGGVPNVGIYRHEVKGKRKLGCMLNPARDAAYIYRRHQELGKAMEVAIFIGHHPAVVMGASSRGGLEHNELEVMGGLLGEPLEVTPGETVSLPVPAWAEIVIEGVIQPGNEDLDGPFGEYAGYYGGRKKVPVIDVTCITTRSDAIYHDLDPAHREHNVAGVLCRESQILARLKEIVPSVKLVRLPSSGCSFFHLYICLHKSVEGQGKLAGLAAFACNPDLKHVIVVDDDIDITKDEEVLWAVATRVEADRDLAMIPYTLGAHLDPSAYDETRVATGRMTTKVIIDATKPATLPFAERIVPPKEAWDRLNLDEYIRG